MSTHRTTAARERPPNRRPCQHIDFQLAGINYTASFGWFPDGRLGEIFVTSHKIDSAADVAARDAAIMASIALQFGAPVKTLSKALCRDARGAACGPLAAALDLIASWDGDR